ncbi:MAG: hypothetical protein ABIJ56_17085, partial [Pseudomonadota bacterium]
MRYEGKSSWQELIASLEEQSQSDVPDGESSLIFLRIGKIFDDFLLEKGEAMAYFQKAVKADPQCREALSRAVKIYEQMGKLSMVNRLLDIELKTARDPAAVAEIYSTKAWLAFIESDVDDAVRCFSESFETDPSMTESENMVNDFLVDRDLFQQGMQMEDQVKEVDTNETRKVASLYNRAAFFYSRDEEIENTLRCLRQSSLIYPDDTKPLVMFEAVSLKFQPEGKDRICSLYDELIDLSGDDLIRHPRLLDYAARCLLRFEDKEQAFKYLRRSLEIKPDLEGAYLFVVKMLELKPDGYARAAKLAESAADASLQKDARLFFLTEAQGYYQDILDDAENSERIRQEILNISEEESAMSKRKRGSKKSGKADDVQDTDVDVSVSIEVEDDIDIKADAPGVDGTSEDEAVEMKDEVIDDSDDDGAVVIEDDEEAVTLERSDEIEEEAAEAQEPGAGEAESRAGEPADEEEAASEPEAEPGPGEAVTLDSIWVGPDESVMAKVEEAQGLESDKPDRALYAWRSVLDANPRTRIAFEGIMRTCEVTEKWNYAVEAHKKLAASFDADQEKLRNLVVLSMAAIYRDRMNQETSSISLYQQVVKSDPTNREAVSNLLEIFSKLGRWPDYVKLLAVKAENAPTVEEQLDLTMQVASLYLDKFNNQGEAIKQYEKVFELDPSNETALDFLLQMYEKRRDWEKYIRVFIGRIEGDLVGNIEKLIELAMLADERVRKPNVSIDLWEKVFSVDSSNDNAISNLATLYERAREWGKLAEILQLQAGRAADPDQKKQALVKLGLIYTDKIQDDAKGVEVWKEILSIDPSERRAMDQLKKRYVVLGAWDDLEELIGSTGKWEEMIRLLEGRANSDDVDVAAKKEIYYRVAHVWKDRMDKLERTIPAYECILELDPDEVSAAQALIPIYDERKAYDKLASVLEIKLKHTEDSGEKYELLLRIASICMTDLGDADSAYGWYVKAFRERPLDAETGTALEEAAGAADKWEELIAVYREVLDKGDRIETIPVALRMGSVTLEKLGRNEEALAIYEGIAKIQDDNEEALEKIESIYSLMGRYEELQEILEKRLDLTIDPDRKLAIRRKMASIYVEALGDRPKAIKAFNRILHEVGDDLKTLQSLGNLYEAEEKWEELINCYERQMVLQDAESEGYIGCLFSIGKVNETKIGDIEKAIESFKAILTAQPDNEAARQAMEALIEDEKYRGVVAEVLEPIFEQAENWEGVVRCLEILADTSEEAFDKIRHLKSAGDLYIDKLGMPEKSFVILARAMRLDPSDPEMLSDLEQISEVLDSWGDLDGLISEIVGGELQDDVRKTLWLRLAKIRHHRMECATDKIIEAYGSVLEIDAQE